jgi:hypothetical protein
MPAATQSTVHYYLWEELSEAQRNDALKDDLRSNPSGLTCNEYRNALWFRGPVDGGRWERIPLHPSDAARFRYPARG